MRQERIRPVPGDVIQLTADFLRSTGQVVGGEGHKRWTVISCNCALCQDDYVATNEPRADYDPELDADYRYRHFHRANVQRVGELVADRVPQAGFLKLYSKENGK